MTIFTPQSTDKPRPRAVVAILLLGLFGGNSLQTWASTSPSALDAKQTATPTGSLDWQSTLQQAEHRLDLNLVTQADLDRVRAEQARADGWLAGAPTLDGLYRNDRPMTNRGEAEMQFNVRLPLRRLDQTDAWKNLTEQAALNAQSREAATRLELIGTLRQLAWDWRRADTALNTAKQQLAIMRHDLALVTRQVKLGEAAEVDRLTVEGQLLAVQDRVSQASIRLKNAQSRWAQMSGSPDLPSDLGAAVPKQMPTGPVTAEDLFHTHPLLRQMASEVGLDSAKIAAERAAGAGAPELGFGVKRDRGDRSTPYDNSVLVTLSLPIGGQVYRNPALAEMAQQRAKAQVALMRAAQQIQSDVTVYQQRVAEWPTRIAQLDQRANLTEKTLKLKEKALRLGELDWSRLLYFEREAADARLQANLARVDYQADQSSLKQSLGFIPGQHPVPAAHPMNPNTPPLSAMPRTEHTGMTP